MNDGRVGTREKISQGSKQANVMFLADFDVYAVQVDDGRDDVDACLLVLGVRVVLVGQVADLVNKVVHKAGLVVTLGLLEFVE